MRLCWIHPTQDNNNDNNNKFKYITIQWLFYTTNSKQRVLQKTDPRGIIRLLSPLSSHYIWFWKSPPVLSHFDPSWLYRVCSILCNDILRIDLYIKSRLKKNLNVNCIARVHTTSLLLGVLYNNGMMNVQCSLLGS